MVSGSNQHPLHGFELVRSAPALHGPGGSGSKTAERKSRIRSPFRIALAPLPSRGRPGTASVPESKAHNRGWVRIPRKPVTESMRSRSVIRREAGRRVHAMAVTVGAQRRRTFHPNVGSVSGGKDALDFRMDSPVGVIR